jgi:hypothetical protein
MAVEKESNIMDCGSIKVTSERIYLHGPYERLAKQTGINTEFMISDLTQMRMRPNFIVVSGLFLYAISALYSLYAFSRNAHDINNASMIDVFDAAIKISIFIIIVYAMRVGVCIRVVALAATGEEITVSSAMPYNLGKKMIDAFQKVKRGNSITCR